MYFSPIFIFISGYIFIFLNLTYFLVSFFPAFFSSCFFVVFPDSSTAFVRLTDPQGDCCVLPLECLIVYLLVHCYLFRPASSITLPTIKSYPDLTWVLQLYDQFQHYWRVPLLQSMMLPALIKSGMSVQCAVHPKDVD